MNYPFKKGCCCENDEDESIFSKHPAVNPLHPFNQREMTVCAATYEQALCTSSAEGFIILEASKKVNFVGPCWILANNDPFSVRLLTHDNAHTLHKKCPTKMALWVCLCAYRHEHTHPGIDACMFMLINTHTQTSMSPEQNGNTLI